MALNLGELVATVRVIDADAQATIARLERQFTDLGRSGEKAAAGTTKLDESLSGAASSGSKAAQGVGAASAAEEKAAATATRHSTALARVAAIMKPLVDQSARLQVATLREAAARARLTELEASGTATTAKLASAQASLIAAQAAVARSSESTAERMFAAGKRMRSAITLPVLAAAAVAIHAAASFDQATQVYVTAAGETVKNLGVVRDGIKRTAEETGTSIKNLTDAQYLVEKAGIRGAGGITLLNAAAKGAREENAQLADVIQAATSVMASYHLGTDKSVQVINALKTGAGQAKVTMEDYARALSTVVPIASANKISIEELFGAYATLTQHGTSAQESTQELAATIRALAAPNRVAMNQMQQLGLSINDVTKNIGKRGLSGTVDLLVTAILNKMGPAGLVLQKTMNQSASASRDLDVMLQSMPGHLGRLAEKYRAGGLSLKEWRDELKKLPTDQAALAKQFQMLADRANGFNTLLRSGDPAAQTFTAALKKMAGGSIGLNTILQLTGENFDGLKARTAEVGKSLHDNAKDVEGWQATSKLAAVQADKLKERLHVLAIDAGTNLTPMFVHLVNGLNDAVTWFGKLDGTQKQILGWGIGVLAALGPVLGLVTRLGIVGSGIVSFTSGATKQFALLSGASEATAAKVSLAAGRIGLALGAGGIGFALGTLTQDSSNATKALSTFASIGIGAAMGAASGPLGALIGGLAGGVTALATAWLGSGRAAKSASQIAKEAAERQKAAVDDLLESLKAVEGQYNKNYRAAIASKLQKAGAFGQVDIGSSRYAASPTKGYLDPKLLTDYVLGKVDTDKIYKALNIRRVDQIDSMGNVTQGLNTTASQQKLLDILTAQREAAGGAEIAWQRYQRALNGTIVSTSLLHKGVAGLRAEFKNQAPDLYDAAKAGDEYTATTGRNNAILKANIDYLKHQAAAALTSGKSIADTKRSYDTNVAALRKHLIAMGFEAQEVDDLIAKYGSLLGLLNRVRAARNAGGAIGGHEAHTGRGGAASGPGFAGGGPIDGPGPKGVDSKWIKAAPGEWMHTAAARAKYGDAMMRAIDNLTYNPAGPSSGGTTIGQHVAMHGDVKVVLEVPPDMPIEQAVPMAMRAAMAEIGKLG